MISLQINLYAKPKSKFEMTIMNSQLYRTKYLKTNKVLLSSNVMLEGGANFPSNRVPTRKSGHNVWFIDFVRFLCTN